MHALATTRFAKTAATRWPKARRLLTALPWTWHLLSLDAPTVAATWCAAFLLAAGVSRDALAFRAPVLFLSLATWLCYVGDRVLDVRSSKPSGLRARHHFYGALWRERSTALVLMVGSVASGCVVLAFHGLSPSLLAGFAALTGASLVYFGWVHLRAAGVSRLAKEAAVGVIFATGCLLPAWTAARPEVRLRLALTGAVFGLLCWLNCVAIERWEGRGSVSASAHASTRWAARRLAPLLVTGTVLAGALDLLGPAPAHSDLAMLGPCLAAAFLLLALLEALRLRLSSEALRILADVALLTPLLWWAARGIAR